MADRTTTLTVTTTVSIGRWPIPMEMFVIATTTTTDEHRVFSLDRGGATDHGISFAHDAGISVYLRWTRRLVRLSAPLR